MGAFFHVVVYTPIYNLLIGLVDIIPGGDLGLAIILATIVVKLVLMPLSLAALRTQHAMRVIEPELKALKETYKDDKEKQAREMFALYKKHGVNPFASILMLFIQIPIVLGLYFVCQSTRLLEIDPSILYSFVSVPSVVSPLLFGVVAVTGSSLVLALITAVTQYLYAKYAIPLPAKPQAGGTPSMQEEFGRAMAIQARFVFPLLIGFIAYASAAIALYFIASNLFMVAQEFFARHLAKKTVPAV